LNVLTSARVCGVNIHARWSPVQDEHIDELVAECTLLKWNATIVLYRLTLSNPEVRRFPESMSQEVEFVAENFGS